MQKSDLDSTRIFSSVESDARCMFFPTVLTSIANIQLDRRARNEKSVLGLELH